MKKRLIDVIKTNLILLLIFVSYYILNQCTGFYIPCIFNLITGLKCPGCGITHCLFELIHLNFKEAFNANPLVFIYLPFIFIIYVYNIYLYIYDKKDKILVKIPNYFEVGILVITIIYGIVRNFY